jgi:hypothetical protein
MTEPDQFKWPVLFNSPFETGVRAVIILNAAYPRAFDLKHLTWFDHLVVHTGDIGGPESLHPQLPQRTGELLVRRRLIETSLRLMLRLHLIEMHSDAKGIRYRASDDASAFVDSMRTSYATALKERANWLTEYFADAPEERLQYLITDRIGKWHIEFQQDGRTALDRQ